MSETLVIYLILKLPVFYFIGVFLLGLGIIGLICSFLADVREECNHEIIKRVIWYATIALISGLTLSIIFPTERQANIMALSYAGFEGIEAVKEMTGESEVAKNSIEAYNTMLKQYIEENSTGEPNE